MTTKRKPAVELYHELQFLIKTNLHNSWYNHADLNSKLSTLDQIIDTARNLKIQLQREK